MGVIKQGILGGFSGAVANVVGSSWKGIAVIKSKPLSVANPKTAAQVENRTQFSEAVKFAKAILVATIKPLLDRIAVQMSGYNFFVSLNKDFFDVTGLVSFADLVISQGTVTAGSGLTSVNNDLADTQDLSWNDNTGDGDALANDVLYGCLYNAAKNISMPIPSAALRSDAMYSAAIPVDWVAADGIHTYIAFRRADGSRASNTAYALGT